MPNWVFNENVFYSTNKDHIKDFHEKLTQWTSKPAMEYKDLIGFVGSRWLGNILISAGFPFDEVDSRLHGRCRGEVANIGDIDEMILDGKNYSFFTVSTVTAWERMSRMWLNILKKHYGENNDIGLAFTSDEESTEFFEMYNPDNIMRLVGYTGQEKYAVTKYLDVPSNFDFDELDEKTQELISYLPEDDEKLETEEEVIEMLSNILQKTIKPEKLDEKLNGYLLECIDILGNLDFDCSINIIPITYIKDLNNEI